MSEQPTSDDLAREVTRATSANPQDRGYIPDQIDGNEQPDGIPSPDSASGKVTQSPYDEQGSLANAGLPPADMDTPPPPTGSGPADRDDITTNP